MFIAICCVIFILMIPLAIIGYRKQKQNHQKITQDLVSASRKPVLLKIPDAIYYGLASRGSLQPHQILSILVMNEDKLFLVVPPVGLMSKIELTIKLSTIRKLVLTNKFVYPLTRYPKLLVITFHQAGVEDQLALSSPDLDHTITLLEKQTGLTVVREKD